MEPSKEYTCRFPGCTARYRRKEHLSRHEAQHTQPQSFKCAICNRDFGRNDTLRRHMQRNHKVNEPIARARHACSSCRTSKSRCEGGAPCSECVRRGIHCSLISEANAETESGSTTSSRGQGPRLGDNILCQAKPRVVEKKLRYLSLYFELFHPHWPFVHQGTFIAGRETSLLAQSMVVIGLWASGEESSRSAAVDLHKLLGTAIRQQKEKWDASVVEEASGSCSWPIPMYQAILLHIIFSVISQNRTSLGLDLKPSLPSAELELLKSLVLSCKKLDMFYYPNMLARYSQSDLPSYIWVGIEELKRFNLALYRCCKALSRSGQQTSDGAGDSIAGPATWELTAADLQFPIPKNDALWDATVREEWDSAGTEAANPTSLHDTLEAEWISKSAELLRFIQP
ncbi:hypothetical protein FQN54_001457 [Arachnomyces sp. PD_36]|nr:hypothetical protein FQN54_001457 [Arachnomyces sp. PD_36]